MKINDQQMEGINSALEEAMLHDAAFDSKLGTVKLLLEVFSINEEGVVPSDRTVRLVLKSVGRIMASLQHLKDNRTFLKKESFDIKDFQKIVRSFHGLSIYGANFIRHGNDSLPSWIDHVSLDEELNGDSDYLIDLFQDGPSRKLDLRIWFHDLTIENSSGIEVPIDTFIVDGERWWKAFNEDDPRTRGYGMYPLK